MQHGIIKHYNTAKGYGFIAVDNDEEDVFFHISDWQMPQPPIKGQTVLFNSHRNDKNQLNATDVRALDNTSSDDTSTNNTNLKNGVTYRATLSTPSSSTQSSPKQKTGITKALSFFLVILAVLFGSSELLPTIFGDTLETTATVNQSIDTSIHSSSQTALTDDVQVKQTLALIQQGGPYPYPQKDGSNFYNREGVLPDKPRGYYREYTVPTPNIEHRGARRIVTGGNPSEVYYLTLDHYDSFTKLEVPLQ